MLEVAVGLTYKLVESKGVGIFCYNVFEVDELMLVYNAYKHTSLTARIRSDSIHLCCAVAELICYIYGNLGRVRCYYREFVCGLRTLDNIVADKVRDKAVGDTECNGLVFCRASLGVDEKGYYSDKCIESKRN